MAGILDFVFGKDALKKAGGDAPKAAKPTTPANVDVAGEAAKLAARKAKAKAAADGATDAMRAAPEAKRIPLSQLPSPEGLAKQFMER